MVVVATRWNKQRLRIGCDDSNRPQDEGDPRISRVGCPDFPQLGWAVTLVDSRSGTRNSTLVVAAQWLGDRIKGARENMR